MRPPARRAARGPAAERPCHNDLLTANFIDDGTRIRIVDWEYAGMGDVFFDLANFSVNNGLSARTSPLSSCAHTSATCSRSTSGR